MEIPAWSYFLLWATISVVFTRLGFDALNKTELSSSVSPLLMSLFKHSLAFSASLSSVSAFVFSPRLKIPIDRYVLLRVLLILSVVYLMVILFLAAVFDPLGSSAYRYITVFALLSLYFLCLTVFQPISSNRRLRPDSGSPDLLLVHLVVGSSLVLVGDNKTRFFPCTLLSIGCFITLSWLTVSENGSFDKLLMPLASRVKENLSIFMKEKKKGKFIEFGVGMVGTILFQNYFKLTSFDHVVAFLYFAVAWLANLALTRGHGDFGIFNFLLGNVMVGCTVSQFGLRGTTWIVYGASLLLYGLRLKIESLSFAHIDGQVGVVTLW